MGDDLAELKGILRYVFQNKLNAFSFAENDVNRRTFLKIAGNAGVFVIGMQLGRARPGLHFSDEEILRQTKTRIEHGRKGDGIITVRNTKGPIAGATVRITQLRHLFRFGCNLFRFGQLNEGALEEQYRWRFADLLNYATLGFYWDSYERERAKPSYDYTDQVTDWCQKQGITSKGHPLVWDFADPLWLPGDFVDIRRLSNMRVYEIVSRYKGRIEVWDVVNEPTHLGRFKTRLGDWAISMGIVPYVSEHLKIARRANPGATLLVNDYRTDSSFYEILDALRDNGKLLFDGIGIQSHMHGGVWPLSRVWDVCDTYGRLGVPIHFTETTIVSGLQLEGRKWDETTRDGEARQADYVSKFYSALFAHPAVEALSWWDFSDDQAWQGAPAGLLRKDMSPKPVYERLMKLIKGEWWTRTEGMTNEQGEFASRAFFGSHLVTVRLPNGTTVKKEVEWNRGKPNRFEVHLGEIGR